MSLHIELNCRPSLKILSSILYIFVIQPHLIEKLVVVDVSTVSSKSVFNFQQYISAMKSIQFDQYRSLYENRKSAGKELETVITVRLAINFLSIFVCVVVHI